MRIGTRWMKCSLAVALLGAQLLAGAQINTWTDQHGRKHFADEAGTPEHQSTTPVTVPPPNVIERFTPPAGQQSGADEAQQAGQPPVILPAPARPQRAPGLAAQQEACKAAKAAYEASRACFAECGKRFCSPYGHCGTNNSACGHCTELPMPHC